MIASSRLVKTVAVTAALGVHGTVVAAVFQGEPIEIAGDGGGVEASIGNSFADMAAGVMTPIAAEEPPSDEVHTSPAEPPAARRCRATLASCSRQTAQPPQRPPEQPSAPLFRLRP